MRWMWLLWSLTACGDKDPEETGTTEGDTDTDADSDADTDADSDTDADTDTVTDTGPTLDLSGCHNGGTPEVFLGRGVGGAFETLLPYDTVTLSPAPQGGFGVSLQLGTRGLEAGEAGIAYATVATHSEPLPTADASFTLSAALECKTDAEGGPHGVVYGVVVGFSTALSNSDLLVLDGTVADLTVTVEDAGYVGATVTVPVTLSVGY